MHQLVIRFSYFFPSALNDAKPEDASMVGGHTILNMQHLTPEEAGMVAGRRLGGAIAALVAAVTKATEEYNAAHPQEAVAAEAPGTEGSDDEATEFQA